jgi:hypothetical protein
MRRFTVLIRFTTPFVLLTATFQFARAIPARPLCEPKETLIERVYELQMEGTATGPGLLPNTRIDVIATYANENPPYATFAVTNVLVIACHDQLVYGEWSSPRTAVRLQLTPQQASILAEAQKWATLSCAFRATNSEPDERLRVIRGADVRPR